MSNPTGNAINRAAQDDNHPWGNQAARGHADMGKQIAGQIACGKGPFTTVDDLHTCTPLVGCRGAFEKWYAQGDAKCPSIIRNGDGYRLMQAQQSWQAWQAAWEAKP